MRRALLVLSLCLVASCSGGERSPDTASPADVDGSPTPTVQVLPECHEDRCEGDLQTGAYRSTYFEPTIDFQIEGPTWTWSYSGTLALVAHPSHADLYAPDGVYFLRNPKIASQDCEEHVAPGIGRSVGDLVEWVVGAPGLAVSDPVPVTIGGLEGMQLDIELDPAWKRTCFFSQKLPVVQLIFNGARVGGYLWTALPGQSMRWYVLDAGERVLIVDIEDGPGGVSREDLLETGTEIVDSLKFS